jgi:N-acetylmuramoyl-L-alanine amidase
MSRESSADSAGERIARDHDPRGDYFVPLEVRAKIANSARNSIFVSIHFNATNDDPNATGFEIFSFTRAARHQLLTET